MISNYGLIAFTVFLFIGYILIIVLFIIKQSKCCVVDNESVIFEKNLVVDGDFINKGTTVFEKNLNVDGTSTVNNVSVENDLNLDGDLMVSGNADLLGSLKVNGITQLKDTTVDGTLIVNGFDADNALNVYFGTDSAKRILATEKSGNIVVRSVAENGELGSPAMWQTQTY